MLILKISLKIFILYNLIEYIYKIILDDYENASIFDLFTIHYGINLFEKLIYTSARNILFTQENN